MSSWKDFSQEVAAIVDKNRPSVVSFRARRGSGATGVAWPESGIFVAANHTLEWDEDIEVVTDAGQRRRAELVGRDPTTDVAALRVEGVGLPVPAWEPPDLAPGRLLVTLGASSRGPRVGLAAASTVGSEYRTRAGARVDAYIETDSRLFPGFSGSLVLDEGGRAIGIATSGLARRRSLVVPTGTLRRVVARLVEHGSIPRGYLGITTQSVRLPEGASTSPLGLIVLSVQPESPAAEAGLVLGDALIAAGGEVVASPTDLLARLTEESVGSDLALDVLRGGEKRRITVRVGSR